MLFSYIVLLVAGMSERCFEIMVTRKNDEAVSPVIGVILMVAITVILAAVIAAFVFGMSGNITKTKIVAATVQQPTANTIVVTYQGGQDAQSFSNGHVIVSDDAGLALSASADYTPAGVSCSPGPYCGNLTTQVGNSVTATAPGTRTFAGKNHVVVVGFFTDSTQQVIIDTYV